MDSGEEELAGGMGKGWRVIKQDFKGVIEITG